MDKTALELASSTIKKSIMTTNWWKYVQSEVATQIEHIVDNLPALGLPFKESFIALFKLEHARRLLSNMALQSNIPSALFGTAMPEECYQSGTNPTRAALGLNDWTQPNDADVQSCMFLCHQIEILERIGAMPGTEKKTRRKPNVRNMFSDIIDLP